MPVTKRTPLTGPKISKAKATDKPYWLRDSTIPGLALRVQPGGKKTYTVLWGRGQARAIGDHPAMTLEGARHVARVVLGEIAEHGVPLATLEAAHAARLASKALTFGDYIGKHYGPHIEATAKAGKETLAAIKKQFGHLDDKPLSEVSRADFDAFKVTRIRAKRQPATINRDLDRLKAALSKAVEWDMLAANPLIGVKRIKRDIEERVRYLSKDEEARLRTALQARQDAAAAKRDSGNQWREERGHELRPAIVGYYDHLEPMTLVAVNTGLRRGEIVQLTWRDIDLKAKRVTVRAGYAKSGKARHVPLNSEAVAILQRVKDHHGGKGRLFSVLGIGRAWQRLMAKAKIEEFRFHDLRHTFASKLVMGGVDLNTVRELLGHGDIKMTLRYAHLAPEHKAAAVELLVAG